MKKLAVVAALVFAASCAKKKAAEEPAQGSAAANVVKVGSNAGSSAVPSTSGSGSAGEAVPTNGSASVGSGSAAGSDAGSAAGSGAAAAGSGDGSAFFAGMDGVAYKDMDKKQRGAYMKKVVLPKARELFSAFDPKLPQVGCKTCHGDGVDNHTFKMPNPKIKKLPGTEEAFMAWVSKDKDAARWSKFMGEQLSPEMAKLVGKQPFDPKTHTGEFSCANCHTMKK
jgi:hypothetical protein